MHRRCLHREKEQKARLASVARRAVSLPHLGANFSDTSSFKSRRAKGSIGHAFTVCIRTENQNQGTHLSLLIMKVGVRSYQTHDLGCSPVEPPLGSESDSRLRFRSIFYQGDPFTSQPIRGSQLTSEPFHRIGKPIKAHLVGGRALVQAWARQR